MYWYKHDALGQYVPFAYTHMNTYKHTRTGSEEDEEGLKSKKTFRSQSVVTQNPEAELMLEGDDDAVSLLQEKEIDNLAGKMHAPKHTHTQHYSTTEQ